MWHQVFFQILLGSPVMTFLYIKANSQYELNQAIVFIEDTNHWQHRDIHQLSHPPHGCF